MRRALLLIVTLLSALIATTEPTAAQDRQIVNLPLIGGGSAQLFERTCPAGHILAGLRWRSGAVLDGIGIKCRPVNADGSLGAATNFGTMAGGNGGTFREQTCSAAIGGQTGAIQIGAGIALFMAHCNQWFDASKTWGVGSLGNLILVGTNVLPGSRSMCPDGNRPAIGIRGRHGAIIDALSLRCGKP